MAEQWQSRIVGYGDESPDQLLANPMNFRGHPKAQQDALSGVLEEVGVIQNVIVNKRTGHVVDGHLRIELALRADQPTVPVTYIDVSEDEEKLLLATFDPISQIAVHDKQKLAELVSEVRAKSQGTNDLIDKMRQSTDNALKSVATPLTPFRSKKDAPEVVNAEVIAPQPLQPLVLTERVPNPEVDNQPWGLREDALFPTDSNEFGIPDLRPDMMGRVIPTRVWNGKDEPNADMLYTYGMLAIPPGAAGGVLCFYTFDEKFDVVWNDAITIAQRFRRLNLGALIAPDFSAYMDQPIVLHAWALYRMQWCARMWQEAGMPVIPNVSMSHPRLIEALARTLPLNPPVVAENCRTTRTDEGKQLWIGGLHQTIDRIQPDDMIIVGGAENRSWLEPALPKGGTRFHLLTSWTHERRMLYATKRSVKTEEGDDGNT